MKLSIIILNHNTRQLLADCIKSLKKSADTFAKEIIVVDNASEDGSIHMVKTRFPEVRLIETSRNLGYAAGNNLGLKQAKGEYTLLLNSDTTVSPETLSTMIEYMDQHPQVGVSTCKVLLKNGNLDPACHRGFPTPWVAFTFYVGLERLFPRSRTFGGYHLGWQNMREPHEIDTPAGAFYLTRKKVLDSVGLLDERFFIYAEDIDLSLRIKQAGWEIMYVPFTAITHHKKSSGRGAEVKNETLRRQTSAHFFATMKLFYDKHYRHRYSFAARWLVLGGIWLVSKIKT